MTEETLFHEALAKPAAGRAAFLDETCAGQPELRAAVEALLAAHEAPGELLDQPAAELGQTVDSEPTEQSHGATGEYTPQPEADPGQAPPIATGEYTPQPEPGPFQTATADYQPKIGGGAVIARRYTLVEKLGEGGMGEVWVAQQTEPVRRRVALKLIKTGMDSKAVLGRFEQERQALAIMDHPNIARVLDGGVTPTGQPFFVMELVNGLPLTKFCDESKLTPRERLELFVPICQAVQHAHQKGIVHRDLKPANILVTIIDGRPVPKVIDFGVAKAVEGKLTDEELNTQFGAIVGTLEYMSPEQAGFSGQDIDTRADIYSLGVILYELLTGLRPIDARRLRKAAWTEIIRIIQEEEPFRPSTRLSTDESLPSLAALRQIEPKKLMSTLRGELDWVVMKCLEKPRDRRYETANALARDIQRYLADEPVEARPPNAGYRFRKFVRRNKGQVVAASLIVFALIGGMIGTSIGLYRANEARKAEMEQREIADTEKIRAQKREQQAIDAVKRFRDAVVENPTLRNSPELEDLRKSLLKEPLAFFQTLRETLQADGDTGPESLARLASAAMDLGRLNDEIGDKQDAATAFREALAIARRLAAEHPSDLEYQRVLAAAQNDFGVMLSQTGALAGAREAHEAALAILRKLAAARPDVTEYQNDLARTYNNLGLLLVDASDPAGAHEAYEAALAIQERLAQEYPTVTAYQSALALSNSNLGNLLLNTADPAGARKAHEAARGIRERLVRKHPTVAEYQSRLAESHNSLGRAIRAAGDPDGALRSYEAALAIQEQLAREHPTVTRYQASRARTHNNIGLLLFATGDPAGARKAHEAARVIELKLATDHPQEPNYASQLGGTLSNLGRVELRDKRFAEARSVLREARTWQGKALAANPRNPQYRQFLRTHLAGLVQVCTALHDAEGVAEAQRQLTELRATDPRFAALDERLAAVSRGELAKDNSERMALAQRAYDKGLHAGAARLWSTALETEPKLGDDRRAQYRYNAACTAALAGCGQGMDAKSLSDKERARLRQQSLDWLQADLAAWRSLLEKNPVKVRPLVQKTMQHWLNDTDFSGVRGPDALSRLPEAERVAWQKLWQEVEALQQSAAGSK